MGFSYLKSKEPLRGDSLLFTSPQKFVTHLIDPGRVREAVSTSEPPSCFDHGTSGLEIQHLTTSPLIKLLQLHISSYIHVLLCNM